MWNWGAKESRTPRQELHVIKKIETVWVTGQFQALAPWELGQEAEFYSISFLARTVHQWYSLSLLFPRIPAATPLVCRRTAGWQVSENCLAMYCSVATSPHALPLPLSAQGHSSLRGCQGAGITQIQRADQRLRWPATSVICNPECLCSLQSSDARICQQSSYLFCFLEPSRSEELLWTQSKESSDGEKVQAAFLNYLSCLFLLSHFLPFLLCVTPDGKPSLTVAKTSSLRSLFISPLTIRKEFSFKVKLPPNPGSWKSV